MASVGKKLTLNFSKGLMTKKKHESRDEFDVSLLASSEQSRDDTSCVAMTGRMTKSSSFASVAHTEPQLSTDDIKALTSSVHTFSQALCSLKAVFSKPAVDGGDEMRVSSHECLAELLCTLKGILQCYPTLHTVEVLTAAAELISSIKGYCYEDMQCDNTDMLFTIDQLALALSSSVSEYLMGDIDNYPLLSKTKSLENLLVGDADMGKREPMSRNNDSAVTAQDLDAIMQKLDSGVEIALQRAKAWAKYAKEILNYVEKKIAFEADYAKNVSKLANSARQIIAEDKYLLFQSIYYVALDQDADFARTDQYTCTLIQTQKFVEPLTARRTEHEKSRKLLKEMWNKELRRMQDAVVNVRKARSLYLSRQQEYTKLKEGAQRADTDASSQGAAKADRKKRQLEEAIHRVMEAETTYKSCVVEANSKQVELERVKGEILAAVRELIYHSDQIMKSVTVDYFQLLHTLTATSPVRLQWLYESSQQYEPGTQYAEYVRRIPVQYVTAVKPFVFEPYSSDHRSYEQRKASTHSSGSGSDIQAAPDDHTDRGDIWGHRGDDTDSMSGSSSKSVESSPSASPYARRAAVGHLEPGLLQEVRCSYLLFRGVCLSHAAQTHAFRRLRTPARCRACDTYVFFQGAECAQCGISSHKKCLETLDWQCSDQKAALQRRMTTFGVDFTAHVRQTHTQVPYLVRRCVAEIDDRGLDIKGIYRVSAVKSKVEKLCQSFECDTQHVDLSDHHPNVIANVLKLYLRQLPEPLLTFKLYPQFIKLAKDDLSNDAVLSGSAEPVTHLKQLTEQLPRPNFMTCGMLMNHLKRVSDCEETNQMSSSNLGIVFGPTLLRPREGAASLDSLKDTPHQTRIVEFLISNVMAVFFPGVEANETLSDVAPDAQDAAATAPDDVTVSVPTPTNQTADELDLNSSTDPTDHQMKEVETCGPGLLAELAQEDPRFNQINSDESYWAHDHSLDGSTEVALEEKSCLSTTDGSDGRQTGSSPGLRRRLLAAEVTSRLTPAPTARLPAPAPLQLTKPFSYSPSLPRQRCRSGGAGVGSEGRVGQGHGGVGSGGHGGVGGVTPASPSSCGSTTDSSSATSGLTTDTDTPPGGGDATPRGADTPADPPVTPTYHRVPANATAASDSSLSATPCRDRQPRYV